MSGLSEGTENSILNGDYKSERKDIFFELQTTNLVCSHIAYYSDNVYNYVIHTHEVPELMYIKQINGSYIAEGTEYHLKAGDLILVPPAVHHSIKRNPDSVYERYDLCFDENIFPEFDFKKIFEKINVINCLNNNIISDIFGKFDFYAENFGDKDLENIIILLLKEMFYNFTLDSISEKKDNIYFNRVLTDAVNYINQNLFSIKSVSEISRTLYITDTYLYKIFKNGLQTSPKKYITSKRLLHARQKIIQGSKPTDIYQECGFNDYVSFYRNYISFFGYSPSQEKGDITNRKFIDSDNLK